jgi:hypothetical protein
MFNSPRPHSSPPQEAQHDLRAAAAEHAATVADGTDLLDAALAEADGRSAPAREQLRASVDELRRRLADEEAALASAEEGARRETREAVSGWYAAAGERVGHQIEAAQVFAIARELADVTANRDVVLATTHPSMHRDIASAFDQRIEVLTRRARALDAPMPEELEDSPPVLIAAAWIDAEEPALVVLALPLEPPAVRALLREAVGDLARQLGGDGEVGDAGGGDEPLVLVARTGADGPRARRDVADRLAAIASARLEGADGWPEGARAAVQAVDDERAGALAAVLVERAG